YMPQDNNVDASLSALEVVLLGLMDSLGYYVIDEKVSLAAKIMQELGIIHLSQRDIMSCSGGQRQMVMFAQVLLKNPKVLLLDEPVSALDMRYQCILLDYVRKYTIKKDLVTLMILHDISLAAQFADELIILCDSKIEAKGSAKSVLTQALIERVYKVSANIFYDDKGLPIIAPKKAI
ncbi:MAG: ABC transporter ATP-binding protein, partial [Helicobacter sp.]|nr:ABC transporter ATP-binding protein [Helicobacter sp.]